MVFGQEALDHVLALLIKLILLFFPESMWVPCVCAQCMYKIKKDNDRPNGFVFVVVMQVQSNHKL